MLIDSYQRKLNYLRLSITDRCNFNCVYCMPHGMRFKLAHEDILTYEEFLVIARAAVSEGVTKIRLTGGEPLVRKNLIKFITDLSELPSPPELCLTTNGLLLDDLADDLYKAGISRINISLDSLDPDNFKSITGHDEFDRVWRGMETALSRGFKQVKLNTVVIRGHNDHELADFARLSLDRPLEVRFIEYMPMGTVGYWSQDKFVSNAEMKESLAPLGALTPVESGNGDGPASKFRLPGAKGLVGLISPVTQHFCSSCNRLRLTADGKIRLCLHSNQEVDIKTPLRSGASEAELAAFLRRAVINKPQRHHLDQSLDHPSNRAMNLIGG
ncbi:MAG: GTP 3',8-cyclase MoaA [Deltaproteobacteria bacterium]|nr:GTP 3',8-cyclase MoaA [Deltaproteobacteria bacterium]MBW2051260.1 GTP 3',8-cyclase MoaA [Deltaproteobacteria bacterium]MBW2142231.1 GTP 3',8-cyclase MoaA [Deltaproteobacteria bacterium]MBW2324063.1 GTP 3',8-cyclase MoaA [Deltaproteobacteria bacterium]